MLLINLSGEAANVVKVAMGLTTYDASEAKSFSIEPADTSQKCVLATDIAGLHVLPAGNHTTSDSEYLASHRTADCVYRTREPKKIRPITAERATRRRCAMVEYRKCSDIRASE